jgi:hypothetical protein
MELVTKEEAKFWRFMSKMYNLDTTPIEQDSTQNVNSRENFSFLAPATLNHLKKSNRSRNNSNMNNKNIRSNSPKSPHHKRDTNNTNHTHNNSHTHHSSSKNKGDYVKKKQNNNDQLPFSSFLLAEEFLDEIDTMDLISSADTLKYLVRLALEYKSGKSNIKKSNDTAYHFFIHRVNDTLLIDSLSLDVKEQNPSSSISRRHTQSESSSNKPHVTDLLTSIYDFYQKMNTSGEISEDKEQISKNCKKTKRHHNFRFFKICNKIVLCCNKL